MEKILKMKPTLRVAASLLIGFGLALIMMSTVSAVGDASKAEVCQAIGGCTADAEKEVSSTLAEVINLLSAIVGAVAVIMIIVGGFRYITSAGDSTKAASARNTIIYALVGLVIVALAQVIVRFVLENAT